MLDYWRVVLIEKNFPTNKVQCSGFAGYGLKPILFDRIFFSGEDLKRSSNLTTILRWMTLYFKSPFFFSLNDADKGAPHTHTFSVATQIYLSRKWIDFRNSQFAPSWNNPFPVATVSWENNSLYSFWCPGEITRPEDKQKNTESLELALFRPVFFCLFLLNQKRTCSENIYLKLVVSTG